MKIKLSDQDENRFGVVTAKAVLENHESSEAILGWCREQKVEFCIVRIPTAHIQLAQNLELAGFFLTDSLVYYANYVIRTEPLQFPSGYRHREATPQDVGALADLAAIVFQGYEGHYHADPHLHREDCNQVYSSWAANSCSDKRVADVVHLVLSGSTIVGFLAIKLSDNDSAEIVLNGVHPNHQKLGLYSQLIKLAKVWCVDHQIKRLLISTQLMNVSVQKVWCRQGFEPSKSFYTFHKWFSR